MLGAAAQCGIKTQRCENGSIWHFEELLGAELRSDPQVGPTRPAGGGRTQTEETLQDIGPGVSEDGRSFGLDLSSTDICVSVLLSVKSVRRRLLYRR